MNNAITTNNEHRIPWNKGKLIGQKSPLKLKEIWAIRIRLQLAGRTRELAMFNLAIDSNAIWCNYGSVMWRKVTECRRGL